MYTRAIRYEVTIERADGSVEMIQCNSRRTDAIKRAAFVAQDRAGWPNVVRAWVLDTRDMGVIEIA